MDGRVISLVTGGTGAEVTGGHLYNRRIAGAAPEHGWRVELVRVRRLEDPFRRARGEILVDSLVAWKASLWLALRPAERSFGALVHQRPGGVDGGPVRRWLRRALDLRLYRRCSLLITTSRAMRDVLVESHGISPAKVHVAEPGVDLAPVEPAGRDLRKDAEVAVLTVANWHPNKGIVELLDAVALLPPGRVSVHLVGDDTMDRRYARKVRRRMSPLGDRVTHHGPLAPAQVAGMYRDADLFVFTSRHEAYGLALAEAVVAGLPVIAWRSPYLAELVRDDDQGCLVTPGDVPGLAAAIDRLAADPSLRERLSAAARRKGASLPTWEATASAFFAAFEGARPRPGQPELN